MNKKLELKDLKDKKIIRLLELFKEKTNDFYWEQDQGFSIISYELARKDKIKAEHKLVLYLNKQHDIKCRDIIK